MARYRRLVLFALLALTLGATVWVSQIEDDTSSEVVSAVAKQTGTPRKNTSINSPQDVGLLSLALGKLERTPMTVSDLNPFAPKSWFVPPPPPPPAPPSMPTAPPLPFTYQGKFEEDVGKWVVYLVKGDQFYAVKKGETFDIHYRVEGIENGNLVIEYLPLAIRQTLPIGAQS